MIQVLNSNEEGNLLGTDQIDLILEPIKDLEDNMRSSASSSSTSEVVQDKRQNEDGEASNKKRRKLEANTSKSSSRQIELTFALGDFDNTEIARMEDEKEKDKHNSKICQLDSADETEAAICRALKTESDEGSLIHHKKSSERTKIEEIS